MGSGCYTGLLNDTFPDCVENDVGGGMEIQLLHQAAAVCFDSVEADAEERGGFFVGFTFGQELENFFFAIGEEIIGILEAFALHLAHVILEQSLCDGRAEEELLVGDGTDRLEEIGLGAILEKVALGAGGEGTDEEGLIAMHAQHDDADVGIAFYDLGSGVDTVELGHRNVHDDYVGRKLLCEADGLAAIAGFADDFDGGVGLKQKLKAFANDSMIIGNEDSGGGWHKKRLLVRPIGSEEDSHESKRA
jgi:hypothetical protein